MVTTIEPVILWEIIWIRLYLVGKHFSTRRVDLLSIQRLLHGQLPKIRDIRLKLSKYHDSISEVHLLILWIYVIGSFVIGDT